jgi:tetratricopeptide (TPR) repeat protein
VSYQVAHLDELDAFPVDDQGLVWRPVRRRFGIDAFGANAYVAAEAGDRVVEDHTEARNRHEELYVVLRGRATFTLDGQDVDAPAGTLVFVRPGTRRGAIAREAHTAVLALGGKPGERFVVSGWEWSFLAFAHHRAGRHEQALEIMRDGVARAPEAWEGHYNLACLLSLGGDRAGALESLRRAVGLNGEARELARSDGDFDAIREDPEFSAIAGEPDAGREGA